MLDLSHLSSANVTKPDNAQLNDHGWEAISGVADFAHDRHLWPQISAGKLNNVTMPRHVLLSYMNYYNETRTHLSLDKDAPLSRTVQRAGRILRLPILGGLHHQYIRI